MRASVRLFLAETEQGRGDPVMVISAVADALIRSGQNARVKEYLRRSVYSKTYEDLLAVTGDYVELKIVGLYGVIAGKDIKAA